MSKPQPAETKPRAGEAYTRPGQRVKLSVSKLPSYAEILRGRAALFRDGLISFQTMRNNNENI